MFAAPAALCASRAAVRAWGVSTIQGRRDEQEDRYAVLASVPGAERLAFFAVYDGHGGNQCSKYAAATLHERVAASPGLRQGNVRRALADGFAAVEAEFLDIANKQRLSCGSTALAVVLAVPDATSSGEITVAHVGDSRGVLCRAGKAVPLTIDHKPEEPAERQRIEALGGFVSERGYCMRVQGVLAMSRALGNRLLKPFVSAVPSIGSVPLKQSDEFFVLATDGLFDALSNQQVVDTAKKGSDPDAAAKMLVQRAYQEGSCDNITCIVVALNGAAFNGGYAGLARGENDVPEAGRAPLGSRNGRAAEPVGRGGWWAGGAVAAAPAHAAHAAAS